MHGMCIMSIPHKPKNLTTAKKQNITVNYDRPCFNSGESVSQTAKGKSSHGRLEGLDLGRR